MNKAYFSDIVRTIKKGEKRFFSFILITMLGVMMFSGLQAACMDLRYTADSFFDEQGLHDLAIQSTLGLTDDDVSTLSALDEVRKAEGIYSETVRTFFSKDISEDAAADISVDGSVNTSPDEIKNTSEDKSAYISVDIELETLSESGINKPYLLKGRMPEDISEVAVTEKFLLETHAELGDRFIIKEIQKNTYEDFDIPDINSSDNYDVSSTKSDITDNNKNFKSSIYTIVGVVIDIKDINNPSGATPYRSSVSDAVKAFTLKNNVDTDIYTSIVLSLKRSPELFTFSDEYDSYIGDFTDFIEKYVKTDRENARYNSVIKEISEKIDEKSSEIHKKLDEARQELIDSEKKLNAELDSAYNDLEEYAAELDRAEEELENARLELSENKAKASAEFEEARKKINAAKEELSKNRALPANTQDEPSLAKLAETEAALKISEEELIQREAYSNQSFEAAYKEIEAYEKEIKEGEISLSEGIKEYEEKKAAGEKKLSEAWKKYEKSKSEAEEKLNEARQKLNDIDRAVWYVSGRSTLSGYSNISSDAESIEAVASVFPVVFFIVAILVSLTTVSRMVEEDRGLIGTYKALGFTDTEIRLKYIIYALAAGIIGALIGTLMGFIALPVFIFKIFKLMYLIPSYSLSFLPLYGIAGPVIFILSIAVPTSYSCKKISVKTPASLMRPKAPKAGSRVFLERIGFIWSRFSFLNKVTARNIFRYKKRLFMTVSGIAGCMALMLFGFAIHDSVHDLGKKQFEEAALYDILVTANPDNAENLYSYLDRHEDCDEYMKIMVSSVQISVPQKTKELSAQLVVVPDNSDYKKYLPLKNKEKKALSLGKYDMCVTCNAGEVLGFSKGDSIDMKLPTLVKKSVVVSDLSLNYLSNYIYMTKSNYEKIFDEKYKENSAFIILKDSCKDPSAFDDDLSLYEGVIATVGSQKTLDQFEQAFFLINTVVYIIIVLSAALAFVVLFTLANTNISERERELATIKVLGFYDSETHLYVNKETVILTLIGILIGIPLGFIFARTLNIILKLPSIYLSANLHPISYVYAGLLTLAFSFAVNFITDKALDKINPVEALKSVE